MVGLISKFFILLLCIFFLTIRHSPVSAQTNDLGSCAFSAKIWILGEYCLISGIKIRYGEQANQWELKPNGEKIAQISDRYSLLPFALASKPKSFGWLEVLPIIEFSLVDRVDKKIDLVELVQKCF